MNAVGLLKRISHKVTIYRGGLKSSPTTGQSDAKAYIWSDVSGK